MNVKHVPHDYHTATPACLLSGAEIIPHTFVGGISGLIFRYE